MKDLETVINGIKEIGLNQEENIYQFLEHPVLKNLLQVGDIWFFFVDKF